MDSQASTPLPRLAPSTRPRPIGSGTICDATSAAVSSTMARPEYDSTVSVAPTRISSITSFGSAASSACTAGDAVSGRVAATISCSASVISPRPIATRPSRPAVVLSRETNTTTPTKISSGDSHDRSNEKTTAISAVPTSAPSITASAGAVAISPWPTNEATIRQVAVLDCTSPVTAMPAPTESARLRTLAASTVRRFSPNTRKMPVRTMCVPQTSRAMAASRFSK